MYNKMDWVECHDGKRGFIVDWGVMGKHRIISSTRKKAYELCGYACVQIWYSDEQVSRQVWYSLIHIAHTSVPEWTGYNYIWEANQNDI